MYNQKFKVLIKLNKIILNQKINNAKKSPQNDYKHHKKRV